jgi:hypothetical protein
MSIDFTEAEQVALIHLVEQRLRVLKSEISHTATNDFKEVLKHHEAVLEKLDEKLKGREKVY